MAVIYAIPGLGCTRQLFEKISVQGHEIKVLEWPVPEKEFTLKEYAKAFIPQIDISRPFYLMGVSFGGMLCVELAEMPGFEDAKTILISSAKNKNEIPFPVKLLKYFPAHLLLTENFLIKIALRSRFLIGFPRELWPQFKQMLYAMPPNYFKYCTTYIARWDRRTSRKKSVHIHGSGDRILWYGNIKDPDYTITGGTHAMVVLKAKEINNILSKII